MVVKIKKINIVGKKIIRKWKIINQEGRLREEEELVGE